jgi:hypothetical protein
MPLNFIKNKMKVKKGIEIFITSEEPYSEVLTFRLVRTLIIETPKNSLF